MRGRRGRVPTIWAANSYIHSLNKADVSEEGAEVEPEVVEDAVLEVAAVAGLEPRGAASLERCVGLVDSDEEP